MKKRYLKLLVYGLVATMLVFIVSGCSRGEDSVAEELGEIISEEVSEEVIEIESEDISIDEVASETVNEESPEKEDESVSEATSAEVSEETSEQTSEVTSEAVSEKEEDSADEEKTSEEEPAFTVEPMTATMYAQRSVNVRKGPSTDYDKIGGLSTNQEVSVTGKASTGWYEISYNGSVGYVSSSYLGTEKVVVQQAPTQPTAPVEPTTPEVPSQPETPPADNGSSIQPIAPEEPTVPIQPTAPAEVTYEVYLNTDMLDLVNGHRTANGVKEVAWASDREQEALDRAKAVAQTYQQTEQLSHSGIPAFARCENLACSYTDNSSSGFYGQYVNSSGHNTNMLTQDNSEKQHSMVSATCKISDGNNVIYINVMLFYT